jgi:DNA-binding MarR family transcriptional regulator
VRWLTAAEVDSWLSVVRLMTWLPWSIDQQLRRDSNLGMVEYQVMARLSQSPERTLRMSSLADLANASLSRLSHLVKRLEERGLVRREPDPADGRSTNAILTDKGFQTHVHREPQPAHPDVGVRLHLRHGGTVPRDSAVTGHPDPVPGAVAAHPGQGDLEFLGGHSQSGRDDRAAGRPRPSPCQKCSSRTARPARRRTPAGRDGAGHRPAAPLPS